MKEATWAVVILTFAFIGVRLGVIILPDMAKGYVNLQPASAPSPGSSPAPENGSGELASDAPKSSELAPAQPAATGGQVNMGGAEQW